MRGAIRAGIAGVSLLLTALAGTPAFAQLNLAGEWRPVYHEDFPERIPGPELANFLGLPINEAARRWALSWDPSRLTLPEHQCQVHTAAYIYRGPLLLRIWEDKDPRTQEVRAIMNYISTYEQTRTIWMDGRPHPPEYAPHTWQGFSTGKWEDDVLTVTTTHIKQGWHRRNGLPSSDQITLTEHFIRHDTYLTHMSIVHDPVYLSEPLVKTQDFVLNDRPQLPSAWLWPCEYVDEIANRTPGEVPHYLPGKNPFVDETAKRLNLPVETLLGGAETMYPEYLAKLQRLFTTRDARQK